MRGRPRKPLSQATERTKRNRRKEQLGACVELGIPEAPDWLTADDDIDMYYRLAQYIQTTVNTIGKSDGVDLARYAQILNEYVKCRDLLTRVGPTEGGRVSGAFAAWERANKMLDRFAGQFGMTPAARQGVRSNSEKKTDELDEILNGVL